MGQFEGIMDRKVVFPTGGARARARLSNPLWSRADSKTDLVFAYPRGVITLRGGAKHRNSQ